MVYVTDSQRQSRFSFQVGVLSFLVNLGRASVEFLMRVGRLLSQVTEESGCFIAFRPVD